MFTPDALMPVLDTRPLAPDWTPEQFQAHRDACQRAAADYDAFYAPEAVEARRMVAAAEARREIEGMRAEWAREERRESVVPFADGAAWLEFMRGMEEQNG